ncbi:hypothetical protein TNCV_4139651 [Trichonephila clavipes]|nr:hypothetical protein TNCV_4139651 [Trichonephila clavipes]
MRQVCCCAPSVFFGSNCQIPVLIRRSNSRATCAVTSTHIIIILESLPKRRVDSLVDSKFLGYLHLVTKNGFFGKVQLRGFTNVGHIIGSGSPSDNLKIIELKDLITNSDRYGEEFVKDMLSVIVEERTATEKQKAAELEEKQKAVVVAQQREREFELEKMKIQLEMQKLS